MLGRGARGNDIRIEQIAGCGSVSAGSMCRVACVVHDASTVRERFLANSVKLRRVVRRASFMGS